MIETTELPQEVIAAIEAKQIIKAVKLLRKRTGCGLLEAKELIESYAIEHPSTTNNPHIRKESNGTRLVLIIIAVVVGYIVYILAK